MREIEEFRTKIEAIKERLNGSNGEGNNEIRELKERLGTVRDSLKFKQETIDSQKAEIAELREENEQLSDMLGQAVDALDAQSQSGIKEIVQSIDSEFASLLGDGAASGEQGDGGRRDPVSTELQPEEPDTEESQEVPSEESDWEPENESPPALQRIMGRHKR